MARKRRRRGNRFFRYVVQVILWIVIVIGAVLLFFGWFEETVPMDQPRQTLPPKRAAETPAAADNTAAAETAETEAPEITAEPTAAPTAEPTPEPTPAVAAKFADAYAENADLTAWLTAGEDIDEPVLYRDNTWYAGHAFDGSESADGAVFMDMDNAADLSDDVLVLYGQNGSDGAVFGCLSAFRNPDYTQAHPIITLQSVREEMPRKYVIISVLDASMNAENAAYVQLRRFAFDTPEQKQAFADLLVSRSMMELPAEVTADDQLLLLVTSSYTVDNGRLLVAARALRDGEESDITEELYELQDEEPKAE